MVLEYTTKNIKLSIVSQVHNWVQVQVDLYNKIKIHLTFSNMTDQHSTAKIIQ